MREMLLTNGLVVTPETPVDGLAVRDGRIIAVGAVQDVRQHVGPAAEVVDVSGQTVLPGFVDAHNHFLATAEVLAGVNVSYPRVPDVEALMSTVAAAAAKTPPGRPVRAFGLDDAKFTGQRMPTRQDLDLATTDHPVYVMHKSGHRILVNTRTLALHGVALDVGDPPGGQFIRDDRGVITGYCLDSATDAVCPRTVELGCHGPNFHFATDPDDLLHALDAGADAYLAAGLTTVCDAQVTRRELTTYLAARRENRLPIRLVCMPLSNQLDALIELGITDTIGDEWLRLGAVKAYSDGALTGGTALFSGDVASPARAVTYWSAEELTDLVVRVLGAGLEIGVHAQGDLGIQHATDAIEAGLRAATRDDHRPRIEHCGAPTGDQLVRFGELGIIPVNQPNFLTENGDQFVGMLGRRADQLQPLRSEVDLGLRPVISSDSFVSDYRPLRSIASAMSRRTAAGTVLGPSERITLTEAIAAHTIDAAHAVRMDHLVGSLTPGKYADLVVIDGDLSAMTPDEIATAKVSTTIVGGDVVYRAPESP